MRDSNGRFIKGSTLGFKKGNTYGALSKGKVLSEETKEKISQARKGKGLGNENGFKKGQAPWNKGRTHLQGKNNPSWKGNDVGYDGLHRWVSRHLGKPDTCENCGVNGLSGKKIHWANKDHEYKRNLEDWLRLCASCHVAYDRGREDNK